MWKEILADALGYLYNIAFSVAVLAGAAFAFLYSGAGSPSDTALTWIRLLGMTAVFSVAAAIGSRIAMRMFYDRACSQAFEQWEADPGFGETLSAVSLTELIGLNPQQARHVREFLERKAKAAGVNYQEGNTPNERHYRFPRPKGK